MLKQVIGLVKKSMRRQTEERREEAMMLHRFDAELTANMRALRLVATMSDHLLSRGMAASDVVHIGLGAVSTYCSRKVHIDISYTILTLSQDRGVDKEPLTIVRAVTPRGIDYRTVQLIEELGREIRSGRLPLDEAEKRLDAIIARPRLYPRWLTHLASGGVSTGVVMLYSHSPTVWLISFIMGSLVSLVLYRLAKKGLPTFYSQALAGLVITLIATAASLLAANDALPFLDGINPTLIIVGGIVLLVAGMMIVSAFQDAIDEYYITATARLLKVVMMTGAIIVGVTVGLYLATRFGVELAATPERLSLTAINYQYIGAAVLTASFALGSQTRILGVVLAGLVGLFSLYIVLVFTSLGFGVIPSSGIAAACVGMSATVIARVFKVPSVVTINSGVLPLVPGLTLYSALTHIAQSAPSTADFDYGVLLLLRAILIAVVVAAGATLGNLVGRPAMRRLIYLQNRLPRPHLSRAKSGKL